MSQNLTSQSGMLVSASSGGKRFHFAEHQTFQQKIVNEY